MNESSEAIRAIVRSASEETAYRKMEARNLVIDECTDAIATEMKYSSQPKDYILANVITQLEALKGRA